jgi:hypothetical protein
LYFVTKYRHAIPCVDELIFETPDSVFEFTDRPARGIRVFFVVFTVRRGFVDGSYKVLYFVLGSRDNLEGEAPVVVENARISVFERRFERAVEINYVHSWIP